MPEVVEVSYRKARKKITPARKRKLAKEREMWESYGLKKPLYVRYTGLQGVLWYFVSRTVRQEDFKAYGGLCVDGCGKKVNDWKEADCGHFQTASRAGTRFMRENLALQTRECNTKQRHGDARHYSFGVEIDRRHGAGTANRIIEISETPTKLTDEWLRGEINKYALLSEGE